MTQDTLLILALEDRWVSKEEIMSMLGGVSERAARDYIAELNIRLTESGRCIFSTAARKGFHIPSPHNPDDIALAEKIDKELESKAISIFQRRKAIRNFVQCAASQQEVENLEQLLLF